MLNWMELMSLKIQFWRRYNMNYAPQIMPCNKIISRCFHEVNKRQPTVYDIWKVRSLSDPTCVRHLESQRTTIPTASVYLAKLHTYLLALAITGSVRKSNSAQEETFGSDSTNYVAAPWDVLMAYYFRAVESARAIPEASRLAWLVKTDTAER